jgi:hypothetical protein
MRGRNRAGVDDRRMLEGDNGDNGDKRDKRHKQSAVV